MEAPRYTAKEIEDGLYSGMDPDVELVAAQYYDALRAELARVKAESLRVVPVGEACGAHDAEGRENFVMLSDEVLMPEPYLWDWIRLDGTHPDITDDTIVQPVRLERWEEAKCQ